MIVCHDEDLQRLCGDARKVKDVNFKDLPKFLKKMPLHFTRKKQADGKYGPDTYNRREGDQDHFSLLEDVFKIIPKVVPMSIDVKDGSNEACMKVIDLLKKYDRFETSVLGSSRNSTTVDTLYKMDRRTNTIVTEFEAILIALCYFTGFLPYLAINRDVFWVPYLTKEYLDICNEEKKNEKSFFKRMKKTVIIKLTSWFNFIGDPALNHLWKRGIFTGYWVINNPSETLVALQSGVQGVMTDHPHGLKKYFIKIGANTKKPEEGKANTPFVQENQGAEKTAE